MQSTRSGTRWDAQRRFTCLMVYRFGYYGLVTKRQSFENVEKWIQIN